MTWYDTTANLWNYKSSVYYDLIILLNEEQNKINNELSFNLIHWFQVEALIQDNESAAIRKAARIAVKTITWKP